MSTVVRIRVHLWPIDLSAVLQMPILPYLYIVTICNDRRIYENMHVRSIANNRAKLHIMHPMEKQRLLERLRKTRSSGKTVVIERWPEIKEALRAGFDKKNIHQELLKVGLQLSYAQFARLTKELSDEDKEVNDQTQETALTAKTERKVAASPRPASKKKPAKPESRNEPPEGAAKKGDRRGFKFNPKPDKDELI